MTFNGVKNNIMSDGKTIEISDIVTYIKDLIKVNNQAIVKPNVINNINDEMIHEIFKFDNSKIKILDNKFTSSLHYDPIQSKFLESHNKMCLFAILQSIDQINNNELGNSFNKFSQENKIITVNKIIDIFLTELKMRNNKKYCYKCIPKQTLQQHLVTYNFSDIFIYFISAYLNINIFIISKNNSVSKYNINCYNINKTFNYHKQSIILWHNNNIFYPISINDRTIFYYSDELFKIFLNNNIKVFDLQLTKDNLFENSVFSENLTILYDNDIELIYSNNQSQENNLSELNSLTNNSVNNSVNDIIEKTNSLIKNINNCTSKISRLNNPPKIKTVDNELALKTEQAIDDIMICVKYTKKELNKMKATELQKIMVENNLSYHNEKNKIKTKQIMINELCEL